jgi:hypothetical protein
MTSFVHACFICDVFLISCCLESVTGLCTYPSLITISYRSKLSNLGFDLLRYGIVSRWLLCHIEVECKIDPQRFSFVGHQSSSTTVII